MATIVRLFFSLLLFDHLPFMKDDPNLFWWSIYSNQFDENRSIQKGMTVSIPIIRYFSTGWPSMSPIDYYLVNCQWDLNVDTCPWKSNRTYPISFFDNCICITLLLEIWWLLLSLLENFSKYQKILSISFLFLWKFSLFCKHFYTFEHYFQFLWLSL